MITIEKPRRRQEGVNDLQYHEILESSFIYYIVGKPGSGKTHLVSQLLDRDDIYKDKFEVVILISPQKNLRCTHYLQTVNIKEIWTIFQSQELTNSRNVLLVFDDVISQIQDIKNDVNFQNIIFNRRNILSNTTISIIFTSQKYILLPPNIRSCITMLFFFQMFGNDMIRICNEWIKTNDGKKKIEEALGMQKEFDFISIRSQPYQIRCSFKMIENLEEIQQSVQKKQVKIEKQVQKAIEKPVIIQKAIEKQANNQQKITSKLDIMNYFNSDPPTKKNNQNSMVNVLQVKKTTLPIYKNSLYNLI